jgi:hypothetical protein
MILSIGIATAVGGAMAEAASEPRARDAARESVVTSRPAGPPVMAIVSLNQQRVTVYDADGPVLRAPVSTGQVGYETPAGIYTVLEKKAEHYSNLYDDASMPFMQRLTWSGIALHAGFLPGYPASHGCVRMPLEFAERLFQRGKLGMRVIVVRDDMSPADFTHPALFAPAPASADPVAVSDSPEQVHAANGPATDTLPAKPHASVRALAVAKTAAAASAAKKVEEARRAARRAGSDAILATKAMYRAEFAKARAEQQVRELEQTSGRGDAAASERVQQARSKAEAVAAAARAEFERAKAEMQLKVDLAQQARQQANDAIEASKAAAEDAKDAARKLSPVSVFISRTTQRLYVRQAREPIFDTPVDIADPDRPFGTYVFTALSFTGEKTGLRWNVVSMYGAGSGPTREGGKLRDRARHAAAAPSDLSGAKDALDRITIPKEAVDHISELIAPGSALIVSDEGLSRETGQATEFIVLMSSEPQGGVRMRRRPEARYRYQRSYSGSPFGWGGRSTWGFR